MTWISLSILFAIFTSAPESLGQDYINFYDDVHPRSRWEDMPQSLDDSTVNSTPEFLDNFFLHLQNRTPTRNENILQSLGESLGDRSYSYLRGRMNSRDRFLRDPEWDFPPPPPKEDPATLLLNKMVEATLRGGNVEDHGKAARLPQFNRSCNPTKPAACQYPGYHKCILSPWPDIDGNYDYRCLCDLQHTEIPSPPEKRQCIKNVYTQCTMGSKKYECGENMDCVPDTLHLEAESFCRCKQGFAPAQNSRGILAFCRSIIKEADEEEEEQEDFGAEQAHAALILIRHSLLLLSLMSIAVMT